MSDSPVDPVVDPVVEPVGPEDEEEHSGDEGGDDEECPDHPDEECPEEPCHVRVPIKILVDVVGIKVKCSMKKCHCPE